MPADTHGQQHSKRSCWPLHSDTTERQTHKAATAQAIQKLPGWSCSSLFQEGDYPLAVLRSIIILNFSFLYINTNVIEGLWNLIYVHIINMLLFSSKPTSKNYQFCKIWFKVHHHLGSCEGNVKWICGWRIQSMIYENNFYLCESYVNCIL